MFAHSNPLESRRIAAHSTYDGGSLSVNAAFLHRTTLLANCTLSSPCDVDMELEINEIYTQAV